MTSSTPQQAPPAIDPAAIADVTYRGYDGELRLRSARWWAVAVATIRASVNRKKFGYWIPAFLTLTIYFFLGVMHYFTQNVREQMAAMSSGPFGFGGAPEPIVNPFAVTLYQGITSTALLVFIAALTVGSATISADNRANALLVYFARPLTRVDYLLGKWMGVFLLLAALTVTPALLMFAFFAFAYNDEGFLANNPTLILRLLAATLLPAALHASLIIGFSAWSKTPRLAGAVYAAFYFVSGILAGIVGSVLLERDRKAEHPQLTAVVANLSVDGAIQGVALNALDVTPTQVFDRMGRGGRRQRRPPRDEREKQRQEEREERRREALSRVPERPSLPAMLLVGGVLIALPLAAAAAKVRAVEVVRG